MFCNQCGKENTEGMKFCVNCGAALNNVSPQNINMPVNADMPVNTKVPVNTVSKSIGNIKGIKGLIMLLLVVILILTATVYIIKMYSNIFSVDIRNEDRILNDTIAETDSYIYYIDDSSSSDGGFYRVNKKKNSEEKISSRYVNIAAATKNGVYVIDNLTLYKVTDKSAEMEKVCAINDSDIIFIKGNCYYEVSDDGSIEKNLNTKNNSIYSVRIYDSGYRNNLIKATLYKNYIYLLINENSEYENNRFIRVSLTTGKEEELGKSIIKNFAICNNLIVCNTIDGEFISMKLDGKNEKEYTKIEPVKNSDIFYAKNYVYYKKNGKLYGFDVDVGEDKEFLDKYHFLVETDKGLAYSDNGLKIIDDSGNRIN
jgi:hypothetical protein